MLKGGPVGGQLVCVTNPTLKECKPRSGTLEDPDEGRLVNIQACNSCIIPMPTRENVILSFVSSVETFFVRKLHVHNIIII